MFLCLWRARQRPPKTQKHLEKDELRRSRSVYGCIAPTDLKVEAFYRSRPVFRVSPQATHEKQEKRVFARTPRAPARGLLPLATPLCCEYSGCVAKES